MKVSIVFIIHSYIAILYKCHQTEQTTISKGKINSQLIHFTNFHRIFLKDKAIKRFIKLVAESSRKSYSRCLCLSKGSFQSPKTLHKDEECLVPFTQVLSVEIGISAKLLSNNKDRRDESENIFS